MTLAITGALTTGPTGRLQILLAGHDAGKYSRLALHEIATNSLGLDLVVPSVMMAQVTTQIALP